MAVLLNCGETAQQLLAQFEGTAAHSGPRARPHGPAHYGVGAQILRLRRAKNGTLWSPRRMLQHGLPLRPPNHRFHPQRNGNMFAKTQKKGTADKLDGAPS